MPKIVIVLKDGLVQDVLTNAPAGMSLEVETRDLTDGDTPDTRAECDAAVKAVNDYHKKRGFRSII